jgi:hypothetical protein
MQVHNRAVRVARERMAPEFETLLDAVQQERVRMAEECAKLREQMRQLRGYFDREAMHLRTEMAHMAEALAESQQTEERPRGELAIAARAAAI